MDIATALLIFTALLTVAHFIVKLATSRKAAAPTFRAPAVSVSSTYWPEDYSNPRR